MAAILAACSAEVNETAGGVGGSATGGAGGSAPETWISHVPLDCESGVHLPGLEAQTVAVELTPETLPTAVDAVAYELFSAPTLCDATLAHTVRVFADAAVPPPSMPAGRVVDVFPDGDEVFHEVTFPSLTVEDGQHLFVVVTLGGDPSGVGCLKTCDTNAVPDTYWRSSEIAPPFTWGEFPATLGNPAIAVRVAR